MKGAYRFLTRTAEIFVILALGACTTIERATLPPPEVTDPGWRAFSEGSSATVDHAAWDRFLARYHSVDGLGIARLDYATVTTEDQETLKTYIAELGAVDVATLDRPEQLAFWINLYNAVTVDLVLDAFPVGSIRNVGAGLLPTGPWGAPVVTVGGKALSLNDIEHAIVRPIWQDARVHYGFNCAAAGCPNLAPVAYRGASVEAMLEANARIFVNDPRGFRDEDGRLVASKVYAWFKEDFGGDDMGVLQHARHYASANLAARLDTARRIDRFAYDWSLNESAQR
ncbi:MAG: DUF547 domain-containing protein [Pseudomonadota bacterium]